MFVWSFQDSYDYIFLPEYDYIFLPVLSVRVSVRTWKGLVEKLQGKFLLICPLLVVRTFLSWSILYVFSFVDCLFFFFRWMSSIYVMSFFFSEVFYRDYKTFFILLHNVGTSFLFCVFIYVSDFFSRLFSFYTIVFTFWVIFLLLYKVFHYIRSFIFCFPIFYL